MVGRKRKVGIKREKNGREQRERVDIILVASAMPHRKESYGKIIDPMKRHDQKAENPFGRLALVGLITDEQYQAGRRFLAVVRRYREVIDSPKQHAPSLMGRLSKSDFPDDAAPIEFRAHKPLSDQDALDRRKDYDDAFCAIGCDDLGNATPRHNRTVLNSVLVHEKELQSGDLPFLLAALKRLEKLYTKPKERRARVA